MMQIINIYPKTVSLNIGGRQDNDPPVFEEINLYKIPHSFITTYGYVIQKSKIFKKAISYRHRNSVSFKNIVSFLFFKNKIIIDKPCLSIANGWYDSYYHFTLECLPKLFCLKDYINSSTVIFPSKISSFHKQWFDILNIKDITFITDSDIVKAPLCITTNFIARDLNHHHLATPDFRNWVLSHISKKDSISYKKIFIGRKLPKHRILFNNAEVKQILDDLGFVYLEMEDYTVEDQVKIFYNAEQIIAVHGAALSNICFCKPSTKIIDLIHEEFKQWCFLKLAIVLNLNYIELPCKSPEVNDKLPGYKDIVVDLEKLYEVVKTW